MTLTQQLITIAAAVAGTMLTRFLPFLLFPGNRPTPSVIIFLGRVLPPAIMGLLVVYALRNVNLTCGNHGLPEALACDFSAAMAAQYSADHRSQHRFLHVFAAKSFF